MATGEYIAFLDCDDTLAKFALNEVVELLNKNRDLDFIYSDEDKIDDEGHNRHMPHFKPDWSPDTLMSHMYTCHFGVYRTSIAREIGGDRKGYEGAQDYDFTLRFTEKTDKIAHIDKILYHWRERVESTAADAGAKPYILEAAKKTKEDALRRRGLKANLELVDGIYQYRVNYLVDGNPKVSVVIPSKDNYKILEKCISSFVEKTRYRNYEFILVDNGSSDENKEKYSELAKKYNITYIYEKMDFNFSKMCNMGVAKSTGDYILLLNDDIEIIDEEWLERMLGQAQLKHIGAVGAKLLYEGGERIQHIGVVNYKVGPSHVFAKFKDDQIYYFGRNKIDYNSSAVTAACLLVNKDKYNEVGGLD
jgi:glycosyltransferase involved in cell wall biosynthesis